MLKARLSRPMLCKREISNYIYRGKLFEIAGITAQVSYTVEFSNYRIISENKFFFILV